MGKARARTGVICAVPLCMSACFPNCGIRFHPFPDNVKKRKKWFNILKISPDDYKEDMMICSLHFNSGDYFKNDCKKGKLKVLALPHFSNKQESSDSIDLVYNSVKASKKLERVSASSDLDSYNDSDEVVDFTSDDECTEKEEQKNRQKPAKLKPKAAKNKTKTEISPVDAIINEIFEESDSGDQNLYEDPEFTEPYDVLIHVCRICLVTGCAMYSMNEYNLEPTYLLLTGINSDMFDEMKMPQMLCFECVKKLQNFIEFSTKSLTAWSLLNDLIEQDKLSMDEIKRIDREKHMLSSKLGYTIFEPNYFDLEIQECVEENKALTNKYHCESLANFKDHKQSTFIDDETYLEMSVDGEDDTFTNIKEEIEEQDNLDIVPNENSVRIKNKNTDKSENPSENVYPSDKDDDDEPSDGEDDFFYSNENVTENNYPIKNAESDSDDDLLSNSNGKQKFSKIYKREFVEMFEVKSLTIEMQKAVIESKKNTKRYKNSLFKCDKCFKAYNFEVPFKKHMKRHTNECGEFVCPACHCHYLTRYNLTNHVRKQHEKYFHCRLCPFKTTTRCTARLHKKFHDGKRYRCKKCPKTFMKPSPFMAHKQRYHPEDAVCHLCGDSHAGFQNLASHIRSAHSGEDLKLPPPKSSGALYGMESVRRKETGSTHSLAYFVTTLPDDSPCCDQCEIRFRDKEAIRLHFAVSPLHGNPPKTKKKVIICEQCGVECGDRRKYARHFASEHPGLNRTQYSGKFMCELCGNVLVTKALLNEHIKMHAKDSKRNIFVCDICGVKRSTKSSMYLHKKDHRLSRKCEICMRVFASQANLNKHSRIHTYKPYACKICNKRFCMPSDRKAHIKHTHMGEPWPKKKKWPKGTAPQQTRVEEDMTEIDQCEEQSDVTQGNEEE